jgi:hypothetical protein
MDFDSIERAERDFANNFITTLALTLGALPVKTAETMAKAAYKVCCDTCVAYGQNPDYEVFMKTPEESGDFLGGQPGVWIVCWESGPFQWAIPASMEIGSATGKLVEPYYSFDLTFYPSED